MQGFYLSNIKNKTYLAHDCNKQFDSITGENFVCFRETYKKFLDDRIFIEDKDYIIITEGYFLNKTELVSEYHCDSWFETIKKMINTDGESNYFDKFRGSFSGAHYCKGKKSWIVYSDSTGSKPLYYYFDGDKFIICSDLFVLSSSMINSGIKIQIDNDAVFDMLTYGYMIGSRTYIKGVHKLLYGECIEILYGTKPIVKRYYDFDINKPSKEYTESEIIDILDALFQKGVKYEFQKDLEYGYKHLVTISGGLDSRMTTFVASENGFNNILNINFTQSDYLDEKYAKKVSQFLGTELLVKSLNDGKFLLDYYSIIEHNNGMTVYSGMCHMNSIIKYINTQQFGLLHTGDPGDAVISTSYYDKKREPVPGAYSNRYQTYVKDTWNGEVDFEKYLIVNRGFNAIMQSKNVLSYCLDCSSPFLYREFFEFCMKEVPPSIREKHNIYKKWVISKHKNAAKIPLERFNGGKLTDTKVSLFFRKVKRIGIKGCISYMLYKMKLLKRIKNSESGMNPYSKWYTADIKEKMDSDFEKYFKYFENGLMQAEMVEKIKSLYNEGTIIEKTQSLTVLISLFCIYNSKS